MSSIIPPNEKRKCWSAVVYTGRDETGKKTHKWLSSKSETELKKKIRAVEYQRDNGTYSRPKGTLSEYLEEWLKGISKYNLSPRTIEGYQSIFKSGIQPVLGKVLMADLKPDTIQKYYDKKLADGASNTTVRHHAMFLHRALKDAVKRQLLSRNPADAELLTLPSLQRREMQTYDEETVHTFLNAAMDTPYYTLFHCALFTGMRRSELLALRWQDVDLIGAEISVSRSMHRPHNSKEIIFRGTKTKTSRRVVALAPESCDVLRKHLDNEMSLWFRLNTKQGDSPGDIKVDPFPSSRLVFCHWDGQPLFPDTISQSWYRTNKELLKAGKIAGRIRLHDARHTHASLMLKAGVAGKIVQERLGHSSISTTMDLYSHVAPGMQKEAVEIFGTMLARPSGASNRLAIPSNSEQPDKAKLENSLNNWSQRRESNS